MAPLEDSIACPESAYLREGRRPWLSLGPTPSADRCPVLVVAGFRTVTVDLVHRCIDKLQRVFTPSLDLLAFSQNVYFEAAKLRASPRESSLIAPGGLTPSNPGFSSRGAWGPGSEGAAVARTCMDDQPGVLVRLSPFLAACRPAGSTGSHPVSLCCSL